MYGSRLTQKNESDYVATAAARKKNTHKTIIWSSWGIVLYVLCTVNSMTMQGNVHAHSFNEIATESFHVSAHHFSRFAHIRRTKEHMFNKFPAYNKKNHKCFIIIMLNDFCYLLIAWRTRSPVQWTKWMNEWLAPKMCNWTERKKKSNQTKYLVYRFSLYTCISSSPRRRRADATSYLFWRAFDSESLLKVPFAWFAVVDEFYDLF